MASRNTRHLPLTPSHTVVVATAHLPPSTVAAEDTSPPEAHLLNSTAVVDTNHNMVVVDINHPLLNSMVAEEVTEEDRGMVAEGTVAAEDMATNMAEEDSAVADPTHTVDDTSPSNKRQRKASSAVFSTKADRSHPLHHRVLVVRHHLICPILPSLQHISSVAKH